MYQVQSLLKIFAELFILVIYAVISLSLSAWPPLSSAGEVADSPFEKPVQLVTFTVVLSTEEECFHQDARLGSTLKWRYMSSDWVDVQVVLTGPGNYNRTWKRSSGIFETNVTNQGRYSYCLTRLSDWSSKVEVSFTFIETQAELRFRDEVYRVPEKYRNLWETNIKVTRNMRKAWNALWEKSRRDSRDRDLLESNGTYVFYWSLAECILIVLAGITQVSLVRYILRPAVVIRNNKPTPIM